MKEGEGIKKENTYVCVCVCTHTHRQQRERGRELEEGKGGYLGAEGHFPLGGGCATQSACYVWLSGTLEPYMVL